MGLPYGDKTSDAAVELVVDLFNHIVGNAPYKMCTITAIYKDDDAIFNDYLRYPIDAPYKPYYQELTDYADKYDLDGLFFNPDGSIGSGFYFFEFDYDRKANRFSVCSSPAELDDDLKARYIPMLLSMVTDEQIDWEAASSDFTAISDTPSYRILLSFGEATTSTLSFSWLGTFQLNNGVAVSDCTDQILNNSKFIVNAVQGVLFSELNDVILQFLKDREQLHFTEDQLKHTRELIKDHKHTLKNFGFRGVLASLYHSLKEQRFNEALEDYTRVENLSLLRDYATDILYNFDVGSDELLLKKHGYDTFTSILGLIHSATPLAAEKRIFYDADVEGHILNRIRAEDIPSLFTVLLNLYSNSRNKGRSDYQVELKVVDEKELMIIFTNAGEMQAAYREFFLSNSAMSNLKGEGISFIKSALSNLKHIHRACETRDGKTIITLTVNHEI